MLICIVSVHGYLVSKLEHEIGNINFLLLQELIENTGSGYLRLSSK